MKRIILFAVAVLALASCKEKKYCWHCPVTDTTYSYERIGNNFSNIPYDTSITPLSAKARTEFKEGMCDKTETDIRMLEKKYSGTYNSIGTHDSHSTRSIIGPCTKK